MSAAEPIRYFSTNQAIFGSRDLEERISRGDVPTVTIAEAVFLGYAPDGGILMPSRIPRMSWDEVAAIFTCSFNTI